MEKKGLKAVFVAQMAFPLRLLWLNHLVRDHFYHHHPSFYHLFPNEICPIGLSSRQVDTDSVCYITRYCRSGLLFEAQLILHACRLGRVLGHRGLSGSCSDRNSFRIILVRREDARESSSPGLAP